MEQKIFGTSSEKPELRFDSNGSFRILAMSDIQESCSPAPETFRNIERMLDTLKPGLVLLIGDNCDGRKIATEKQLREYISLVAKPFEDRKIPWAQVWGNHDHDVPLDKDLHQALYMSHGHNVSDTVPEISGQSNFVLPIYASNSDDIVFNVWGLDSGPQSSTHADAGLDAKLLEMADNMRPKVHPSQASWGLICFDQLMWYYNTSKAIEEKCGRKIPSLLATHVPLYEFSAVTTNPEKCGTVGVYPEHMWLGTFNCGLFAALIQRGDIKAVCSGHTHNNTQCGSYCGVLLCNDGSIGMSCYGDKEQKGARIFELCESEPDTINTYFVRSMDL